MNTRRSLFLLLSFAAAILTLGGASPTAAHETSITVRPNPAHPSDLLVLTLADTWSDSCVPRLYTMRVERVILTPFHFPSLVVDLVSGGPDEGCLAVVTPYRLDIPLPLRAEEFPFGLHVAVNVHPGGDAPSSVELGQLFVDVRSGPREKLPLHDGLFEVTVEWIDTEGHKNTAKVVPGFSENSGLFWFFRPANWELLVKVLDGCALNGHYWVLGAGATNVGYTVRVDAPHVGPPGQSSWSHVNPVGQRSRFFVDIEAIPCAFPGGGN